MVDSSYDAQYLKLLGFEKNQIVMVNNHDLVPSGNKMQIIKGSVKPGAVAGRFCNRNTCFGDLLVTIDAKYLEKI